MHNEIARWTVDIAPADQEGGPTADPLSEQTGTAAAGRLAPH